MYSFMQNVLVSQPGCAGSVLVTVHTRTVWRGADSTFFFPSVFVSCILQRGKMLKCYKALTCNIPWKGEVGGKWIRAGSRFCFLLRASLQNVGDSRARKPLRQAHRSLCNVSSQHRGWWGRDGGGRRGVSNRARYKNVRRNKALQEGARELLHISCQAVLVDMRFTFWFTIYVMFPPRLLFLFFFFNDNHFISCCYF